MRLFSHHADENENQGSIIKTDLDAFPYMIDFADGMATGVTITSAAVSAVDSQNVSNSNIANAVGTVSGNYVTVNLKTGGAGGTGAAADGARFRVRTAATLSSGATPLVFDVFILIQAPAYSPLTA